MPASVPPKLRSIARRLLRWARTILGREGTSVIVSRLVSVAIAVALCTSSGPSWVRVGGTVAVFATALVSTILPQRITERFGLVLTVAPLLVAIAVRVAVSGSFAILTAASLMVAVIALTSFGWRVPAPPQVRNLPVRAYRQTSDLPPATLAVLEWALLGAWLLVGATLLFITGPVPAIAVAAVTVAVSGFVLRIPLSRWLANRSVRKALTALDPVFAMPYAGGAIFHIEMWERFIKKGNRPYIIVTVQDRTLDDLANQTDVPVLVPAELSSGALRAVLPPSIKAAFYVHNSGLNKHFFKARKDVTHVFLHHGDGDKQSSSNPKSRHYDLLLVAGQAAIDRYALRGIDIPREKFVIGGRPQTEAINVVDQRLQSLPTPTILYAPTWAGRPPNDTFSSLPWGEQIVAALVERNVRVIFRPHPVSRSAAASRAIIERIEAMLDADSERSGIQHVHGEQAEVTWGVTEVTNESDAMISDVSGIVTDYLQSGKPLAMVTTDRTVEDFREHFPTSRAAYVISLVHEGTLASAIGDMLGSDPLHDRRWQLRDHYLGGFGADYTATDAFVGLLDELAEGRPITLDPSGKNDLSDSPSSRERGTTTDGTANSVGTL